MKRMIIVVIALLIILPSYLFAQEYAVDKGAIMIGGEAGFTKQSGDLYEWGDEGVTSIEVNPLLVYFLMPNVGVGAQLMFDKESQGDESSTTFGIGPTAGYLMGNEDSKVFPFVRATFGYASQSGDWGEGTGTFIDVSGGAIFMVAKNVGISAAGFYSKDSWKPKDADESISGNQLGVRIGIASFVF